MCHSWANTLCFKTMAEERASVAPPGWSEGGLGLRPAAGQLDHRQHVIWLHVRPHGHSWAWVPTVPGPTRSRRPEWNRLPLTGAEISLPTPLPSPFLGAWMRNSAGCRSRDVVWLEDLNLPSVFFFSS